MTSRQKVLVTGAGGFIGGRVIEVLYLLGRHTVRAAVRQWASCARIGRFPMDVVRMDLLSEQDIETAMQGISVVIHCAKGSRETMVEGTRKLARCALKRGVKRFIYLSSIAVYGKARGSIHEIEKPQSTGDDYGDAKIEAEQVCRDFQRQGLPVVILRPTIVYGPHSGLWTEEVVTKLAAGQWGTFGEIGNGKCNLLYVDDLVRCILACMEDERAVGQIFHISGPEIVTWNEYFRLVQKGLDLPELVKYGKCRSSLSALLMEPVRQFARYVRDNHMGAVKWLADRSRLLRRLIKWAEARIKGTPSLGEFALWSTDAVYEIDKLKRILGFAPIFGVEEGLRLTHQWIRHLGYISVARTE